MICEKCGEPIAQDALYCENCGARAALQADAAQARSASARKSMPLDEGGSPEHENPASEDAARPGRKRCPKSRFSRTRRWGKSRPS